MNGLLPAPPFPRCRPQASCGRPAAASSITRRHPLRPSHMRTRHLPAWMDSLGGGLAGLGVGGGRVRCFRRDRTKYRTATYGLHFGWHKRPVPLFGLLQRRPVDRSPANFSRGVAGLVLRLKSLVHRGREAQDGSVGRGWLRSSQLFFASISALATICARKDRLTDFVALEGL